MLLFPEECQWALCWLQAWSGGKLGAFWCRPVLLGKLGLLSEVSGPPPPPAPAHSSARLQDTGMDTGRRETKLEHLWCVLHDGASHHHPIHCPVQHPYGKCLFSAGLTVLYYYYLFGFLFFCCWLMGDFFISREMVLLLHK